MVVHGRVTQADGGVFVFEVKPVGVDHGLGEVFAVFARDVNVR